MTDSVDNLVAEMATEGEKIAEENSSGKKAVSVKPSSDINAKRESLLKAAANGDLKKSAKAIEKLTSKGVESLYLELEAVRHQRAQVFLCDMFLSKFAKLMGGLGAVQDPEVLEKELMEDPLLRNDITRLVSYIEPYVPLVGILSGGITVGAHVMANKGESDMDKNE